MDDRRAYVEARAREVASLDARLRELRRRPARDPRGRVARQLEALRFKLQTARNKLDNARLAVDRDGATFERAQEAHERAWREAKGTFEVLAGKLGGDGSAAPSDAPAAGS